MLGDLKLKDLKISVKEYQELNKNASAMQVAMILTHSEELEEIFNPFLNRFEDDELYQVFYLLCRYIDECYENCKYNLFANFHQQELHILSFHLFVFGFYLHT